MKKVTNPFDEKHDVVVIGSGIGGLTCATLLAKNGMGVKVFEQHSVPGGYCTCFSRKGFKFSSAVVFVSGGGPEGEVTKVLADMGLKGKIEFRQVKPLCKVLFPGESFVIPTVFDEWVNTLTTSFPKEKDRIVRFFNTVQTMAKDMKKTPPTSDLIQKYQHQSAAEIVDEYVTDPRLKAVITSVFFGGLPPSRFSAPPWCVATYDRIADSPYWPVGGAQKIADVIVEQLQKFGGHLELKTGVGRILIEDKRAVGVETNDGRRIGAKFVVSNAATRQTFGGLVSPQEMARVAPDYMDKLRSLEIGMPSMSVYLGIDLDPRSVGVTNFLTIAHESFDVEKEWEAAHQGKLADTCFSIGIPTLLDSSIAPPKKHIVHLFAFAPYYLPGSDWSREAKARLTDILIHKAERVIPGLSKHIVVQESATPRTNERYTLNTEGATGGWARTPANLFTRPSPKTPIAGLYLAGHWTNRAGGIRNVTIGGHAVAQMILSEQ